jgi:pimeloyl-ACP methyl ester carboxylesterase
MLRSSIAPAGFLPIVLLLSVGAAALFPSAHAQTAPTSPSPRASSPRAEEIGPKLIEADPEAGFEYPYYLYAPETTRDSAPILVEPNTSRLPSDNYDVHLKEAKREIKEGLGRHLSNELAVPIVKPVFPRPAGDPVDWTHSVQKLDRETMQIEEGPLRRVDRQLLSMVEDARRRLEKAGHTLREGLMLNGFSASGVFASRFAALHPKKVISLTAGGVDGMPLLPFSEIATRHPVVDGDAYPLRYQVGTAGIEALTGAPFDRDAFREVRQYLYIGGQDENDALLYPDAYTSQEIRMAALLAYGADVHEQRFPRAKAAYEEIGAEAAFRIYEGAGHSPSPAASDVIEFHRRALSGDPIESVREDLGGNVPDPSRDITLLP